MKAAIRDRRGFALPAAVFGLVVVGVLVTGGFYVARQESRIGVATENSSKAFYLAERGVNEVMTVYGPTALSSLAIGSDTTFTGSTSEGTWEVDVSRTAQQTFFLDGTGTVTLGGQILGGATRRVGMIAKIYTAEIDPPAALTTQGELTVGGSAEIYGSDQIPSDWSGLCDPSALDDKPGIMIDDSTGIKVQGGVFKSNGDPPILEDTTITSDSMLDFGGMSFDDLAQLADINFYSSTTVTQTDPDSVMVGGVYECDTSSKYNWGAPKDPGSACGNHFPIIYAHNDLNINSSSSGQGILLVEGDLALNGGYEFFGPVIVKGTLSTQGTGGHILGAVIAANVDLDTSNVLGNAVVQFMSCTVARAVANIANLTRFRPIAERSWVDMSNLGN